MLGSDSPPSDMPPSASVLATFLGRHEDRIHALGEYDHTSYPLQLKELLARRTRVTRELLELGITEREKRRQAVPRLRELLVIYPHPLIYEALIHVYLDEGRFDEAKGAAFAARQRRLACARSPHPEIQAEIEYLREWTPEEIDAIQHEQLSSRSLLR